MKTIFLRALGAGLLITALSACVAPRPDEVRGNFHKNAVYQSGGNSIWECKDGYCQQLR